MPLKINHHLKYQSYAYKIVSLIKISNLICISLLIFVSTCYSQISNALNLIVNESANQEIIQFLQQSNFEDIVQKNYEIREINLWQMSGPWKNQQVLVIGGGPVGLFTAIALYREGLDVTLLEKRESYQREQIIGLNQASISVIKEYFGDNNYNLMNKLGILEKRPGWKGLRQNNSDFESVRLQQLEYLWSILLEEQEKFIFNECRCDKNRCANKPLKILRSAQYLSLQEATENGIYINFQIKDKYLTKKFDFVIGADGANSKSAADFGIRKLSQSGINPAGILMMYNPVGPHKGESLRYLQDNRELNESEKDSQYYWIEDFLNNKPPVQYDEVSPLHGGLHAQHYYRKLKHLGWNKKKNPANRIFMNGNITYIAGEIPEHLLNNRDQAIKWFKTMMKLHLPRVEVENMELLTHVESLQIFPVELYKPSKFLVRYQLGFDQSSIASYLTIGDNGGTPHLLTSLGVNTGYEQVKQLSKLIRLFILRDDRSGLEIFEQKYSEMMQKMNRLIYNAAIHTNGEFYDGPFLPGLGYSGPLKRKISQICGNFPSKSHFSINEAIRENPWLEHALRDGRGLVEVRLFCDFYRLPSEEFKEDYENFSWDEYYLEHMKEYLKKGIINYSIELRWGHKTRKYKSSGPSGELLGNIVKKAMADQFPGEEYPTTDWNFFYKKPSDQLSKKYSAKYHKDISLEKIPFLGGELVIEIGS